MALAPFFERVLGALGGHLAISRESLDEILGSVTVGIECGKTLSQNDQWIAELSVNLLARLYPRLFVLGPEAVCAKLQALALHINPQIEFVSRPHDAFAISLGSAGQEGSIYPKASGWVARLEHARSRRSGPTNPYSSAAAATFACAELFRRAFLKTPIEPDAAVSLLNFDATTGADLEFSGCDLGQVLFVGAGAVGNAALWTLGRDDQSRGHFELVDAEVVELSNLQRYVLADYADINASKVAIGVRTLAHTHFKATAHPTTLEEFAQYPQNRTIPVTVISVDNIEGRRAAQALLPRLIVNGWTGGQSLGASWHVFSRDAACLACLYQPRGKGPSAIDQAAQALGLPMERTALLWVTHQPLAHADIHTAATTLGLEESVLQPWLGKSLGDLYTNIICGAVPLDVKGIGKLEMVPLAHQSALAGILMVAELVKRSSPDLMKLSQREPLVAWDDILKPSPRLRPKPRAREPGCICGDPDYQRVYRDKWP
jgi:hypothetical protein